MRSSILLLALSFSVFVAAHAKECHPGYYTTGSGECKKCPKGTFQSASGKDGCRPCPDGTVSTEAGSIECVACDGILVPNDHKSGCECPLGAGERRGKCTLCPPGQYSVAKRSGRKRCNSCNEGEYQPEEGQTKCLKCPKGSTSVFEATECITCPDGEALIDGECGTCPAGQHFMYGGCQDCDAGSFKAKAGLGPCLPCPEGLNSESGAKKCKANACPDGKVPIGKRGRCGKCKAGRYYDSYSKKCKKCYKNSFMPYENVETSCLSCAGQTFSMRGATECTKCPLGTRLLKDGECSTCPAGRYYDSSRFKCRVCGINEFSTKTMDYCKSCPSGSFAKRGATSCFACPRGEGLILKQKGCGICPAGTYFAKYSASCEECYEGSIRSEPSIKDTCDSCPNGTTSNKERTECISA